MPLILHRSAHPDSLARSLAALLAREPSDVFTPEVVVVPARGVERWLTQRLSHALGASPTSDDGVCAGLEILTPHSLVSLVLGRERDDPWQPDRLVWSVLAAIDACVGTPGFESLTHHLGADDAPSDDAETTWRRAARRSRRYATAQRLCGLFCTYLRERPGMLAAWEAERPDGGADLEADLTWQPPLWRAVVAHVLARGVAAESPSARHARVVAHLREDAQATDLPARLSLFGHNRFSSGELELLDALAMHREVHLWLPHPSPQLWRELQNLTGTRPRREDTSATAAHHPLLASLGRDTRELEQLVLAHDVRDETPQFDATTTPPPATRLGRLHEDIEHDRPPQAEPAVDAQDRSIQVHACHGPARQVEALREVLVWLLDESMGRLQPRDIIVMCPDVETYAPLIHATFGLSVVGSSAPPERRHPGQSIRVQLADRSLAATNPLVDVAQRLLTLVSGRMTASEVVDFAAHPAVARRFAFDEDDIAHLTLWAGEAGVRWGLDAEHRGEYGLRGVAENTWDVGLDRLALGVAVSADSTAPVRAALPLDDVGSNKIPVAGRVLELLERLRQAARSVREPSTLHPDRPRGSTGASEWMAWLRASVLGLAEIERDHRWQVAQFEHEVARVAESAGPQAVLRLTDVRVMIEHRWAARATRSNFRTGAVTVCTMVPMRSVPHKAVIVLGVDDGSYPRRPVVDGDDVLARCPLTGERDARSEDSQLLLDAVMAAEEYFVALYSGFDERTGDRRPPAVPLQEVIAAAARTGSRPPVEFDDIPFVHEHPLQAFDERNFTPDGPIPGGTYDAAARAGAEALRNLRRGPGAARPFVSGPLPAAMPDAVTVDELVAFYENPAREFLRTRVGITVPREEDELDNAIPLAPGGLDEWKVGDRLLTQVLGGTPLPEAVAAERRRGSLPPGDLAGPVIEKVAGEVNAIAAEHLDTPLSSHEVSLTLAITSSESEPRTDVRLSGTIDGVQGDALETITYSRVAPKHIVGAWTRLLAARASGTPTSDGPDTIHANLRGRGGTVRLEAPGPEESLDLLAQLVQFRAKGLQFPLGVPPSTANAYTRTYERHLRRGAAPGEAEHLALEAASREWVGSRFPGENDDVWWVRLHGPGSSIDQLNTRRTLTYWGPRIWAPIHAHGGLT